MRSLFRLTLLLVLLVIVGSAAFTFYAVFFGGKEIRVPKLEGMSVIEAVDAIQKLELVARVDQIDSLKKPGTVLAQWPAEGAMLRKGKAVILKVSKGGTRTPLPDVRGMEYEQAVQSLQQEGFTPGDVVRIPHKMVPPGAVIAQNPSAPAAVPSGVRIDLLVSAGGGVAGGPIVVPDLEGRTEIAARKMLEKGNLKVGSIRYQYTQASPAGIVLRIFPAAGSKVAKGTRIELVVATDARPTPAEADSAHPGVPGAVRQPGNGDEIVVPTPGKGKVTPTEGVAPQIAANVTKIPVPTPTGIIRKPTKPQVEGGKTARIRYQVPPLLKPLNLRIELVDRSGTKQVLNKEVKGGEFISLNESYANEAVVTIYLGGEFVWQDRYQ